MKLKIEMNIDNEAFQDDWHGSSEIGRILTKVVQDIANGETSGVCRDWNGNAVGRWGIIDYDKCTMPQD